MPGDRLLSTSVIESVSDVKQTALGTGRFVTTRIDFVAVPDEAVGEDADPARLMATGEPVATMRFRILKFRPGTGAAAGTGRRAGRPRGPARRSPRTTPSSSRGRARARC